MGVPKVRAHLFDRPTTIQACFVTTRDPLQSNRTANEFNWNATDSVRSAASHQQAPRASVVVGPQMEQVESTIDQLCDRPLKGVTTNRNGPIIVPMLGRNSQPQIEVRLPPGMPRSDQLIIEQSQECRMTSRVPTAHSKMEPGVVTLAGIMASQTSTAPQPNQHVVIQSSHAPQMPRGTRCAMVVSMTLCLMPRQPFCSPHLSGHHRVIHSQDNAIPVGRSQCLADSFLGHPIGQFIAENTVVTRNP